MLTANQHFVMAHPLNQTSYIDKDFQYICLLAKSSTIYEDLMSNSDDKFYDFESYKYVLNEGLRTDSFESIETNDFATLINMIDYFYSDFIDENRYAFLIKENKLQIDPCVKKYDDIDHDS